jgi:hypothetical protein
MRLNKEKVSLLTEFRVNDDCVALCDITGGFTKMMVFYKFGKVVWAHKEMILLEKK